VEKLSTHKRQPLIRDNFQKKLNVGVSYNMSNTVAAFDRKFKGLLNYIYNIMKISGYFFSEFWHFSEFPFGK